MKFKNLKNKSLKLEYKKTMKYKSFIKYYNKKKKMISKDQSQKN